MPSSLRKAFARRGAIWVLAAWGAALLGCSQEGTTPTCDDNVTKDGILINATDKPCQAFGQCIINGERRPADDCCVDDDGELLGGYALELCRYGFGEIDLDSTGGSGGGGAGGSGGSGGG